MDLHEILLKACRALPNVDLNQATTVSGFSQTEDLVGVETSAGIVEGSALIAADGLRSRLRTQLHPQDTWRDTGYVAHRTIVRSSDAPASMRERTGVTMHTGEEFHVIFYPLRGATEINIVGVFKVPADAGSEDSAAYRKRIGRTIARARPQVHDVVSVLDLERRWSIADRHPVRGWCQGRVTLIGDSAHATLQSLAQGAGMALEDALALSRCMVECPADPAQAFKRFERERFVRTARVVLESRSLWHTYHCGGVDAQVRDQQLQERTPEDMYRCLDWLWNPQPSPAR